MRKSSKNKSVKSKQKMDVCIDYSNTCQKFQVGELWDADPNCVHELDETCMSGIKCKRCRGWFCY